MTMEKMNYRVTKLNGSTKLGMYLRTERYKRGLTLEYVASHCEIAVSMLSCVERGKRKLKNGKLELLAALFGKSLETMVQEIENVDVSDLERQIQENKTSVKNENKPKYTFRRDLIHKEVTIIRQRDYDIAVNLVACCTDLGEAQQNQLAQELIEYAKLRAKQMKRTSV